MANSDVKAKRLTATGATNLGRARLRQVHVLTAAAAGRLTLTDGDGGPTVLDIDFVASDSQPINIPDQGLLFASDIHVSLATNITSFTIFYA